MVFKDTFIIYGGVQVDGRFSNELWELNITTLEWRILEKDNRIVGRSGHTLTAVKNKLYLFGGKLFIVTALALFFVSRKSAFFSSEILCITFPSPQLLVNVSFLNEKKP